jgi:hypothetical protein
MAAFYIGSCDIVDPDEFRTRNVSMVLVEKFRAGRAGQAGRAGTSRRGWDGGRRQPGRGSGNEALAISRRSSTR